MFPLLLVLLLAYSDACLRVKPSTPGMPATACKTCDAGLITISRTGNGAKEMFSSVTDITGACAVRTFICKGEQASIEFWGVNDVPVSQIDDEASPGTAVLPATCNAAGKAWEYMGIVITRVECASAPDRCRRCTQNQIDLSVVSNAGKPMTEDITDDTGACLVRFLICEGTNAEIELFTGNRMSRGPLLSPVVLTCNTEGTGWEHPDLPGEPITAAECSYA